jgi:hypothetical protein
MTKFFCDDHSVDFSPQPYRVSKLMGYCQRKKTAPVETKLSEESEAEGMLRMERTYTLAEEQPAGRAQDAYKSGFSGAVPSIGVRSRATTRKLLTSVLSSAFSAFGAFGA